MVLVTTTIFLVINMSLQFEGDISGLSDKQSQFISDVLTGLGFTNSRVVFKLVTKLSDNDASNVHRITVKNDGEDFKMIAKIAPEAETLRAKFGTGTNFSNEIAMYKQVLPKFARVQTNADVADEDRFKYPKCYGCLSEEPHEVILLEDLKVSNYVMLDMFTSLSDDAVKLVLKKFSMLHALSFAMKKHEPGIYHILQSKLVNIWNKASVSEEFKEFFNEIENSALEVLDDDKYIKAVRGLVAQTISQITKIEKYEMNSKHLVIQHGDVWTNNLMFKFEEEELTDNIMIDYRSSCQGNPVGDILYMIFSCTDHVTRSQHFHDWVDYYHDQLDNSLSNFDMKASFVYPKDQLDADLKRYSKIYFGTSILLYNLMCKTSEEASHMEVIENNPKKTGPNVDTKNLSNLVKIYKTKIEDLVDSYREFGFLA